MDEDASRRTAARSAVRSRVRPVDDVRTTAATFHAVLRRGAGELASRRSIAG